MNGVLNVKRGVERSAIALHLTNCLLSSSFHGWFSMVRWIAFDQDTTSILRSTLAQGTRIDTLLRGPVDYALARPSAVIAVLPASGGNGLGLATFRRVRAAVAQRAAAEQLRRFTPMQLEAKPGTSTRAGGFLGLRDEAVFDDEVAEEKKGWWQKFWDE
jgi:hypothetical protein